MVKETKTELAALGGLEADVGTNVKGGFCGAPVGTNVGGGAGNDD